MCLILTLVFIFAAFSFFFQGLIPHAIISAIIAAISLFLFVHQLITNGRCIFGKDRNCNKPK
jgi:hypothetical protein